MLRLKHEVLDLNKINSYVVTGLPRNLLKVCHVNETKIKNFATKTGYSLVEQELPRRFILNRVETSYMDDGHQVAAGKVNYFQITYQELESGTARTAQIPSDFIVVELIGLAKDKIMKKFVEAEKSNIIDKLGHQFQTGSDPEIFVEDEKGAVIPAFNFLPSKDVDSTLAVRNGNGQKIYWDGFQAEFTVRNGGCIEGVLSDIAWSLGKLEQVARKHNPNAKLSLKTVMHIPDEVRATAKDEHVALGCMPSLNAYEMKGDDMTDGRALTTRSTGGHLHFGIGKHDEKTIKEIVKSLDAITGVLCVSLFAGIDNPVRRKSYGLAGEYRLPSHGIEYRTLSNAWLCHPFISNVVIDVARKAVMVGMKGFRSVIKATEQEVIDCIQRCDVDKAREIIKRNEVMYKQIMQAAYLNATVKQIDALYNLYLNGVHTAIKNPENISVNWNLSSLNISDDPYSTRTPNLHPKQFRSLSTVLADGKKVG